MATEFGDSVCNSARHKSAKNTENLAGFSVHFWVGGGRGYGENNKCNFRIFGTVGRTRGRANGPAGSQAVERADGVRWSGGHAGGWAGARASPGMWGRTAPVRAERSALLTSTDPPDHSSPRKTARSTVRSTARRPNPTSSPHARSTACPPDRLSVSLPVRPPAKPPGRTPALPRRPNGRRNVRPTAHPPGRSFARLSAQPTGRTIARRLARPTADPPARPTGQPSVLVVRRRTAHACSVRATTPPTKSFARLISICVSRSPTNALHKAPRVVNSPPRPPAQI